jgi:CRISPR-associated protein Cmr4
MTLFTRGALLMLYTETSTHVGAGESETADLAIQRHSVTRWPLFQSSSLKGALRSAAPSGGTGQYTDRTIVFGVDAGDTAFGGDSEIKGQGTGLLSVGDANLLAFPIASLAGVFAWITCPEAIRRFQRSHGLLPGAPDPNPASAEADTSEAADDGAQPGAGSQEIFDPFAWDPSVPVDPEAAHYAEGCQCFIDTAKQDPRKLVLQDTVLNGSKDEKLGLFAAWLADRVQPGTSPLHQKLRRDLLLVHDDIFADLVDAGIHIVTRVKIDDNSRTVAQSGPWDEELLPAESVLYAPLQARYLGSGSPSVKSADDVLRYARDQLLGDVPRFQIGAGATIGWGIVAGSVIPPHAVLQGFDWSGDEE